MELQLTRDPDRFAAAAGPLLEARVECNVAATVLAQVRRGARRERPPLFAFGRDAAHEVCFAALRTPPWPMLASALEEPAAAGALVAAWLAEDPAVPGVGAEPATARAISAAWSERTGGTSWVRTSMALHAAEEVTAPAHPAAGRMRLAEHAERELLVRWEEEFVAEAGAGVPGEAERTVERRLGERSQLVWEDGGVPVSTLALTALIAGVRRIGAVYTPPELRNRGYAGSLVAQASARALESGARSCILFTDLANPASNRLYASLGYRRIGDWEDRAFTAPSACR